MIEIGIGMIAGLVICAVLAGAWALRRQGSEEVRERVIRRLFGRG